MDADGWKQTAARGEGRKEGRKGWRSDGRWGTATLHLGRPTGATSFHIWYPVRPRSWNLPEKEIRASFTCSRALYVCSSRGENIDAPLLLVASRAPLLFPTRANHRVDRATKLSPFRSPFEFGVGKLRENVSWEGTNESIWTTIDPIFLYLVTMDVWDCLQILDIYRDVLLDRVRFRMYLKNRNVILCPISNNYSRMYT